MKDVKEYTLNEAREIINRYFNKMSCGKRDCNKCVFCNEDKNGCINFKDTTNEIIAKAEEELNQVDWSKVAVNTRVLVRNNENYIWNTRYFTKYENGEIYAWSSGKTSWSVDYIEEWDKWKYAELVEVEE